MASASNNKTQKHYEDACEDNRKWLLKVMINVLSINLYGLDAIFSAIQEEQECGVKKQLMCTRIHMEGFLRKLLVPIKLLMLNEIIIFNLRPNEELYKKFEKMLSIARRKENWLSMDTLDELYWKG